LIKTNDFGDTLWTKTFGGSLQDNGRSVLQTPDMGYIIVGDTYSYGGYNVLLVKTTPEGTKIEQDKDIIALDYSLQQNYPNPFNPTTQIIYTLPHSNIVFLIIYDLSGKEVQTLVNEYQTVGNYSVDFDASNLSSGIYFYKLKVGNNFVATRKMILTR
jgi:Secretion system C-terminal sorting domain